MGKIPTDPTQFELRPSEKVLQLLESNALSAGDGQESRLPPMRALAKHLDVSLSTVSAVYKELAAKGRIRTQVGNGSFLINSSSRHKMRSELRIATNLRAQALAEVDSWHYRIAGGVMIAALETGATVTLKAIGDSVNSSEMEEQLQDCSAVIILPVGSYQNELWQISQHLHLPSVFLHAPFDGATENFVSADFLGASRQLGEALRKTGRKNVAFMMSGPFQTSTSSQQRMIGLLAGLNFGADPSLKFSMLFTDGDVTQESGRMAFAKHLDAGNPLPDAIYTAGDHLALGCIEELRKRSKSLPGEVSVIGGAGLTLEGTIEPQLTRCHQPFEDIGRELIRMLRAMLTSGEFRLPGKVLPMGWLGGASTSDHENEVLFRK